MANTNFGYTERFDPRFDALIPLDISLALVADFSERPGPHWLEGPAWDRRQGYLLFSDVKANAIYHWDGPSTLLGHRFTVARGSVATALRYTSRAG